MRGVFLSRLLLLLSCSLGVTACNTTASRELVVSIQNYDARSREAIDAVSEIERRALDQPAVPAADAERQFVIDILDPRLKLDGTAVNAAGQPVDATALVGRRVHPDALSMSASPDVPALEEMRCVHTSFTSAFADVERAGIFGKKTVADHTPDVLDQLIAQQLVLARIVQGPARADLRGAKTALVAQMERVRRGTGTDDQKAEALLALRTGWLAVEADEARLTAEAVAQLVKAAATGVALRDQLEAYGQWSVSDLSDSAKALTAFISATRGTDLTALNSRIDEIRLRIESDPDFAFTARSILASVDVPASPASTTDGMAPTSSAAMSASPTPCLDRMRQTSRPAEAIPDGGQ